MSTGVDSLVKIQESGTDSTQQERILRHLLVNTHKAWTRDDIATELGMLVSSVCARLNELVAAGKVAVSDNTWSAKTNRNVNTYKAVL